MTKTVLFLGNGSAEAAKVAEIHSVKNKIHYNGLLDALTDGEFEGSYHTSIYDLSVIQIEEVAKKFDRVVVLPQGAETYQNFDDYVITMTVANRLQTPEKFVTFTSTGQESKLFNEITEIKSFCVLPFIGVKKTGDEISPCCWFDGPLVVSDNGFDFFKDQKFREVRQQMISGGAIPQCGTCSFLDLRGAASPRVCSTLEWAIRLGIPSISDVPTKLVNYDIRTGNKCNLMCRTCDPAASNLIDREYYEINLTTEKLGLMEYNEFEFINLETVQRLYVAGGEPTINQDFITFLHKCVTTGQTDFEIVVNTNAVAITDDFLNLVKKFSVVKFEISIDGFDRVNQYIRWPTVWSKFTKNVDRISSVVGSRIAFNSVISIYNACSLYDLYKWLDDTYPAAEKHFTILTTPEHLRIDKHPNKELVAAELARLQELPCYQNSTFRSNVDAALNMVKTLQVSHDEVNSFFSWNDRLDYSRGVKLSEFIPSLDACRNKSIN